MNGEVRTSAFGQELTLSVETPVSTSINAWSYAVPADTCLHVVLTAVGYRGGFVDRYYRSFTIMSDAVNNLTMTAAAQIVALVDEVQGDAQLVIDANEIHVEVTGPSTGSDPEKWSISISMLTTV